MTTAPRTPFSFTLLDSTLGACAIVWGANGGVCGTLLPAANPGVTRVRVLRRFAGAREAPPPAALEAVITRI